MATKTYIPIASITLGSTTSSVTFSNIPQNYRDLVLLVEHTSTQTGETFFKFNNDTGSNYHRVFVDARNGSTSTSIQTQMSAFYAPAGDRTTGIMNILDYSKTDRHKTSIIRFGNATYTVQPHGQRWANNAAITEINLDPNSGSYNTGSTFSLYGIEG